MPAATAVAEPPDEPPLRARRVPGVARRPETLGVRSTAGCPTRAACRAHHHEARRRCRRAHDVVVVGRLPVAEELGGEGQPLAGDRAVVLDRDRHAGERALVAGADLVGRGEGVVGEDVDERVELGVERLDAIERGLRRARGADSSPERTRPASSLAGRKRRSAMAPEPSVGRPRNRLTRNMWLCSSPTARATCPRSSPCRWPAVPMVVLARRAPGARPRQHAARALAPARGDARDARRPRPVARARAAAARAGARHPGAAARRARAARGHRRLRAGGGRRRRGAARRSGRDRPVAGARRRAHSSGWTSRATARPLLGERAPADAVRRALGAVALDAAHMLGTREEAARIRVCASETCSARFYDRSPAGRRRWCSMALCGNEAKARRHRERSRGAPA